MANVKPKSLLLRKKAKFSIIILGLCLSVVYVHIPDVAGMKKFLLS